MEAPHFPEKYQLLAQVLGKIHRNGLTDFHINPKQLETQLLEQYLQDHDEQPPFNYQGPTNKTPNTNNKPDKKMGNREKILEHLQENPEGICDDCLSIHLDIKPRQQVNQITNKLKTEGLITREKQTHSKPSTNRPTPRKSDKEQLHQTRGKNRKTTEP